MKININTFTLFSLTLVLFYLTSYGVFVDHFKNDRIYEAQLKLQNAEKALIEREKEILAYQLKDLQMNVALLLPKDKELLGKYEYQNIASIVRGPANVNKIDLSGVLFAKGKKYFAQKKLLQAIRTFEELETKYPLSIFRVESDFLKAESYFLLSQKESSVAAIEKMIMQYPENELTGFAMLRLGHISEQNSNYQEAFEIYKAIDQNFNHPVLKKQVSQLLNHQHNNPLNNLNEQK